MDHASFQSFIKTILIILLVYYFFKFALRLLAPYLLKKAVNKVTENMYKQQQQYHNHQQTQQTDFESELKQNKIPKEKNKVGEYIDFEEIK